MARLTVPASSWSAVLAQVLHEHQPLAYALVIHSVSSLDLSAVVEGMDAVPPDNQDDELLFACAVRGRPPWVEMAKIRCATTGRRLDTFREMQVDPAFAEGNLVLDW